MVVGVLPIYVWDQQWAWYAEKKTHEASGQSQSGGSIKPTAPAARCPANS
jgi:hypothetical protein